MERVARTRKRGSKSLFAPELERKHAEARLENIRQVLGSDAAVAEALGVSPAQPGRWREGQEPDIEDRDRIIGLDTVISLLTGYLAASSIPKWLRGLNPHCGDRRPIDVLRDGHLSDVIAAIEAEKIGAFA